MQKGIQVVSLSRDEIIASIAAIETVIEKCGQRLMTEEPAHYQRLQKANRKLKNLLFSPSETMVAKV